MPYEGEYASYRGLQRVADTERVQQLLRRARVAASPVAAYDVGPQPAPQAAWSQPEFVVAIDGSNQEVAVENGYPGAKVGYLTVASVLVDLMAVAELDEQRPSDPVRFRDTERASTIDAALPGSNVVTRTHGSARVAFREELFDVFHEVVVDSQDRVALLDTYEALLAFKPTTRPQACPYGDSGCPNSFVVPKGLTSCPCPQTRPIWSTDALRIHERFNEVGTNGEAFGEVMQVWERVLLVHLLRALERRGLLQEVHKIAFFIDGPLALFGHPAWLAAAISAELRRINSLVRAATGHDIVIVGIEKSGAFVNHFEELDKTNEPGVARFSNGSYFLPTDDYIKNRIIFSDSPKRYGEDTYFGRKFFYKTASGARIVASIPFLDKSQDSLASSDSSMYPSFGVVCSLLDRLVSCRYPNAVSPIVSAHSHASIPLYLGAKVLEQLAQALMRQA